MYKYANKQQLKFEAIEWPKKFIVEFNDGIEQVFTSAQGVSWDNGSNLEGEDENRANISCCWKNKSPSQQHYKWIQFFVDEVKQIKTLTGETIWSPNV